MAAARKTILIDLLRHGQPEGGEVLRGRIDHALDDSGWQQMQAVLAAHGEPPWTRVITSPLQRCHAFAASLSQQHSLECKVDERLQEIDYGDWDGLPMEQWRKQAAPQFRQFRSDLASLHPPNGEAYIDFRDRVLQAWDELREHDDGSHLLLVTHGGVLRVILPTVLGMPLNDTRSLNIPFACYSRVALRVGPDDVSASLLFHNAGQGSG